MRMISLERRLFFKKREERFQHEFDYLQPVIRELKHMLLPWPEIENKTHIYGGTEFRIFNKSIGHIHGNGLLDLPFRHALRHKILKLGLAEIHPFASKLNWVSVRLNKCEDIGNAKKLLLISYWMKVRDRLEISTDVKNFIVKEIKKISLEQELLTEMCFITFDK